MTIYLDIVMLENVIMNYIILYATGFIYKTSIKHFRILLSSIIGGVYAVVSFMEILPIYSSIGLKIVLSIGMVYLAYNAKNLKILLKQLLVFYLTSFAFGGIAFALLYFIKPQDIFMKNGLYIGTYPIKIVLLGGIVGFAMIRVAYKKLSKKEMFCKINFEIMQKEKELTAMLDTGNLLREPITGNPVVVVERSSLLGIIPDSILENIEPIIAGQNLELRRILGKISSNTIYLTWKTKRNAFRN